MSTQKLPIVLMDWRAKPRTMAMAMARPAAAEVKLCIVRPAIWTK